MGFTRPPEGSMAQKRLKALVPWVAAWAPGAPANELKS